MHYTYNLSRKVLQKKCSVENLENFYLTIIYTNSENNKLQKLFFLRSLLNPDDWHHLKNADALMLHIKVFIRACVRERRLFMSTCCVWRQTSEFSVHFTARFPELNVSWCLIDMGEDIFWLALKDISVRLLLKKLTCVRVSENTILCEVFCGFTVV